MREAGAPSTGRLYAYVARCARPTGGGHGLTTDAPAQRRGAQGEGRVGGGRPSTPVQRGQQYKHYKGRGSTGLRPKGGWYRYSTGLRPPQASQELLRASYPP